MLNTVQYNAVGKNLQVFGVEAPGRLHEDLSLTSEKGQLVFAVNTRTVLLCYNILFYCNILFMRSEPVSDNTLLHRTVRNR